MEHERWIIAVLVGVAVLAAACSSNGGKADLPAALDIAAEKTAPDGTSDVDFVELTEVLRPDATLTVMTFNVLCFFCNDVEYDPWEDRLGYFTDIFQRHDPDLIGLQELLFFKGELEPILEQNPAYSALYFKDETQDLFKEYADAAILYRTDRFEVVQNGCYWLSETPDVPLSGGWADSNLPRLVAWAHLRQLSDGSELYFASTHFDNNSPNQEMSAPIFVEHTASWATNMPAIVVGDFNSRPDSPAYQTLISPHSATNIQLLNTFDLAADWAIATNQTPLPAYDPAHRIDHIFVAGDHPWSAFDWAVDMYTYGPQDRYPSDHFAIIATLTLP